MSSTEELESRTDEDCITDVRGREIYSRNGLYIGDVSDLRLDFNSNSVSHLVVRREDINPETFSVESGKKGVLIPYDWVRSVGDIVIINNIGRARSRSEEDATPTASAD